MHCIIVYFTANIRMILPTPLFFWGVSCLTLYVWYLTIYGFHASQFYSAGFHHWWKLFIAIYIPHPSLWTLFCVWANIEACIEQQNTARVWKFWPSASTNVTKVIFPVKSTTFNSHCSQNQQRTKSDTSECHSRDTAFLFSRSLKHITPLVNMGAVSFS